MKKSKNEVNHDRFVGEGKPRKLKSVKSQRHNSKQNLRDYVENRFDHMDDWDYEDEYLD